MAESIESTPNNPIEEAKEFLRESIQEFSGVEVSDENMHDLGEMINGAHDVRVYDSGVSMFWYWLNQDGAVEVVMATFEKEEDDRLIVSAMKTVMNDIEIVPYKEPEKFKRKWVNLEGIDFFDNSIRFFEEPENGISLRVNED
jgi:hypothetical protein